MTGYTCGSCRNTSVDRAFSLVPRFRRNCGECGFSSFVRDTLLEKLDSTDESSLPDEWNDMPYPLKIEYISRNDDS